MGDYDDFVQLTCELTINIPTGRYFTAENE